MSDIVLIKRTEPLAIKWMREHGSFSFYLRCKRYLEIHTMTMEFCSKYLTRVLSAICSSMAFSQSWKMWMFFKREIRKAIWSCESCPEAMRRYSSTRETCLESLPLSTNRKILGTVQTTVADLRSDSNPSNATAPKESLCQWACS